MGLITPGLHAPESHYLGGEADSLQFNPDAGGVEGGSNAIAYTPERQTSTSRSSFSPDGSLTRNPSTSTNGTRSPGMNPLGLNMTMTPRQTSLSNFVVMRHSQRSASLLDLSASTLSLFSSPGMPSRLGSAGATGLSIRSSPAPAPADDEDFLRQGGKLKPVLLQAIEEVINELETTHEDVSKRAREHINAESVTPCLLSHLN